MIKSAFADVSVYARGARWLRGSLKSGASILAVGSLLAAAAAHAQDEPAPTEAGADEAAQTKTDDTIVVSGIRGALESAAQIKRNASTFVDSITASDIATLPDLSVAEALGRIPGLTVSRFPAGGGASPDFPSPEGRGNLIRGLGFVRSEFNGRDAFTANGGRALDWSSIPPELVGAVDVYKNQSADLIEGGIGGTINLRTLEPFDRRGPIVAVAVDGTYSDLRKKWSPSGSITLGNRWRVGNSEFGLLGSYSRSILDSRIHGWQQNSPVPKVIDANGNIPQNGAFNDGGRLNEFAGVDPSQIVGMAGGFQMRTNDVDRDRESFYGAAQWKNDSLQATFKYVRVETKVDSTERTLEWWPEHDATWSVTDMKLDPSWGTAGTPMCSGSDGFPANPGDCETLIPIRGGLMESGLVNSNNDGWIGAQGIPIGSLGIGKKEETTTQDFSLNLKWNASSRLYVELDGQYTKSSARFRELWAGMNTWLSWNVNQDLDNPTIEFFTPTQAFSPGSTRYGGDLVDDPATTGVNEARFIPTPANAGDLNGANFQYASDGFQLGTGELYALRADLAYDLSGGDGLASWFHGVKFGVRYSERSQVNSERMGNWGSIAPAWDGRGGLGIVGTFQDPSAFEAVNFSDFFRGGVVQGANNSFVFMKDDYLSDYSKFIDYLHNEPQLGTNYGWTPHGTADGTQWGSPIFLPENTSDITEKTKNAYVRVDFKQEFGNGMSIDGNIGLRYVKTNLTSAGYRSYRVWNADVQTAPITNGVRTRTDDAEAHDDPRDFLPQSAAYSEQAAVPISYDLEDEQWLPSFNMKWNLNREMLIRVGASKGLSRPNVQDLRASQEYVVTTNRTNYPTIVDTTDPLYGIDRGAQNITIGDIRVNRGNPFLKPTTAWNYDLSYEWYFKGGYLSVAGFYKSIKNIISTGDMVLGSETLDGKTVQVIYNGQVNQASAKVKGIELAYQQFFDFLPGPLKHLGVQANYTFIDATTTPPGNGVDADGDGNPDDVTTVFRWGVDDMLGQSKHIANAVGIYQDDRLEMRLAYNWRSKYLTTYRDWVTGHPVYNSAAGFLDASIKYKVFDQVQVRASIANILDTKSKARTMIDEQGQMYDRFSFLNDRRIVVGVLFQM
ncbi:MAG: TonB-dependent receptor [Sphingomonas sp.]|uniref:TonB-dependent receptor n=1 Tax=Sphingomonas sp. TaxID=28214 RepID=UPI001B2D423C|nr:TonB-dependent receptor [Sphingomonas sp.]MBO9624391.1 TonB-dependent receptor [Sphingomonas sp.]